MDFGSKLGHPQAIATALGCRDGWDREGIDELGKGVGIERENFGLGADSRSRRAQ